MADSPRRDADDNLTFEATSMKGGSDAQPCTMVTVGAPEALASLFKKLTKVQKHFKKLQHTGKYSQGSTSYTYATEADVVEPISQKLAAEGLALIPSVVEMWWHDIPSKYNINRVCTVHVQVMIGCADTGGFIIASSYSTAANGDKATNAAFTTAVKYFMAKLVGVSFGDDADEYSADGEKVGKSTKAKALTKDERDDLTTRIKDSGKGDAVKELMKQKSITFSKIDDRQAKLIEELLG